MKTGDRKRTDDPFGSDEGPWLCSLCKHGRMMKMMQFPYNPAMSAEFGEGWKGKPDEVAQVACFCKNPDFFFDGKAPHPFTQRVVACEGFENRGSPEPA